MCVGAAHPAPHLVSGGVPVVHQTGGDEEEVVVMAAVAVVPAAVATHFGFAPGQPHRPLTPCGGEGERGDTQVSPITLPAPGRANVSVPPQDGPQAAVLS